MSKKPRQSQKSWEEMERRDRKQMTMLRMFKAREERIVVGLTAVTLALDKGDLLNARKFMGEMMREDLQQAVDTNGLRDLALKTAVDALTRSVDYDDGQHWQDSVADALRQIKAAVPELWDAVINPGQIELQADEAPRGTAGLS